MVCFAQFRYNVKTEDISQFIVNATRYFPNTKWNVSLGDMTISTNDLTDAVIRLRPEPKECVEFDTKRIWRNLSFNRSIPPVDFDKVIVTDEQRGRLSELAGTIYVSDGSSGCESLCISSIHCNFADFAALFKLIHERTKLEGFYLCPSSRRAWIRRGKFGGIEIQPKSMDTWRNEEDETVTDQDFRYSSCFLGNIVFDFDDGFCKGGDSDVPQEFHDDYSEWKQGGYKGEVLKVRM